MTDSIKIIHPTENDDEYAKWKSMVCRRDSFGVQTRPNIDSIVKEAEEFWKNRK
jgi:hypothetical protein